MADDATATTDPSQMTADEFNRLVAAIAELDDDCTNELFQRVAFSGNVYGLGAMGMHLLRRVVELEHELTTLRSRVEASAR